MAPVPPSLIPGQRLQDASWLAVGTMFMSGLLYESFVDNVVAFAGGGQTGATPTNAEIVRVTTVATLNDSIMLPPGVQGLTVWVINHGLNAMQVFGVASETIDDIASATGVSQMPGSMCLYTCATTGKWYSNGLGTGYAGSFETMSYANALTAKAGGAQVGATPITTMMSRFTTVVSGGDSGILPTSVAGMNLVVMNASANSMNMFPDVGGQINALGANAAFAIAAGKTATFFCTVTLQWHALLSA